MEAPTWLGLNREAAVNHAEASEGWHLSGGGGVNPRGEPC